jgi:hypothetical protein
MTTIITLSLVSLGLVPVVVALTQIVKTWVIDNRWVPLVSIAFGILGAFIVPETSIALTVLQGVLIGLSASGLFSGGKTVAGY